MATQYKPNPTRAEMRKEMAEEKVAPPRGTTKQQADIFEADKGIKPPSPDEGPVKKKAKGGKVKSASARADGCCVRGKTRA